MKVCADTNLGMKGENQTPIKEAEPKSKRKYTAFLNLIFVSLFNLHLFF
jgi:hypothetical protein